MNNDFTDVSQEEWCFATVPSALVMPDFPPPDAF